MGTVFFLILFSFLVALVLSVLKSDGGRDVVVIIGAIVIAAVSIYLAVTHMGGGSQMFNCGGYEETISYIIMGIETCLAIIIIYLGIKYKKYLASLLALVQTPLMIWFELSTGHGIEVANYMYIDEFTLIMILIIGIIGTLICVYALGYMKDHQKHNEGKDRRPWFFFLLFLFLAAMYGLVTSNNLTWMYFFWEVTSLCSFFLIGFNKDKVAIRNSFRALIMNLLGGLGFAIAIIICGSKIGILELDQLIAMGEAGYVAYPAVMAAVGLLCFAGITKAAQMPFNSWLLGAMVAPTPTSALLHSSTMVKAGVFIIIKLAPCLGLYTGYGINYAGVMVILVGGITFLLASLAAISQSNAKKVLAYSTIANLGLIVACGGIGTDAAVWAGVMLIIFHAVTKSLLFLCVGTAEHRIGSRNIEDMDGLFDRLPKLAACMIIGIGGMFLAPLGMLVSKWAALAAFINLGGQTSVTSIIISVLMLGIIVFGSAATVFYWTKWMGKLSAKVANEENIQSQVHKTESFVHIVLVALVVIACLCFPLISTYAIVPWLAADMAALSSSNMLIMVIMTAVIVLMVLFFFGNTKKKIVPIYLAGANMGDNLTYEGSMQTPVKFSLRNWYMENFFGEWKMNVIGVIVTSVILIAVLGIFAAYALGGAMTW